MFRRWLSNFYRKNKEKIAKFVKVFGILILIGIALAHSIGNNSNKNENNSEATVYTPTKTIISGDNIDKETYKEEENLVKTFVEYCNNQQIQEAYNLLTNECKEKIYPNVEAFKNNYYDVIFNQNRECNLQSWVATGNYDTYKVRFTEDIMSTGVYDGTEKYEDYITVVTKENEKKLNINGYVKTEEMDKTTKTDEVEAQALNVDTYINYVIYNVKIKNITEKDILLDSLSSTNNNIKLIGSNNASYKLSSKNLSISRLKISPNENKNIELRFIKDYGSDVYGEAIQFGKFIKDYDEYKNEKEDYNSFVELKIKLK